MSDARDLLDQGLRLEKAGTFDRALSLYAAAHAASTNPSEQSEAWRRQSHVRRLRCEWDQALNAAHEAATLAEANGLPDAFAEALNAEAAVHQSRGDYDLARALYDRMLAGSTNERIRGVALQNLGALEAMQGDYTAAGDHFREALVAFEQADYAWGRAHVKNNLGRIAFELGHLDEAEQLLQGAIEAVKLLDDLDLLALARLNYGEVMLARSRYGEAEAFVSSSLGHYATVGNQWRRIECLRVLGDLHTRKGMTTTAQRFYQTALEVAEEIGAKAEQEQLRSRIAPTVA